MREKLFIVSCVLITALLTQSCATHEDNRNLGLGIAGFYQSVLVYILRNTQAEVVVDT